MMATVPHTPAPCEPLTTLVTALFGDQPTPASPLPTSGPTAEPHWQDAVTRVGEQLRAQPRRGPARPLAQGAGTGPGPRGDPPPEWHRQRAEREADLSPGAGLPLRRRHAPGRALPTYPGR